MSSIGIFSFFITWFTSQKLPQQGWGIFSSICLIFTLLQTANVNASTLFQDVIWDHSFLASVFLTLLVCDQKSNQNGAFTFLLQLEGIAPKRAPSRMCFLGLHFEVSNRPFSLRGHVTSFYENESYMILSSKKKLVGHILNEVIVI